MARIRVDLEQLNSAIKSVNGYTELHKVCVSKMISNKNQLSSQWQGLDAAEYLNIVGTVLESSEGEKKFVDSLESYHDYLKKAKKVYTIAQDKARARAVLL